MKALNTMDLCPWTTWFVYGDTRSGKTEMASTFPKPLFIIPKNEKSNTTLMGLDVDYFYITSPIGRFNEATGEGGLIRGKNAKGEDTGPGLLDLIEKDYTKDPAGFKYQSCIFESVSHYCDMIEEMLTEGATRQMDQLRWGKMKDNLRHIHMRLTSLQWHVVYTSLAQIKTNEHSKISQGMPLIPGKGAAMLPSSCDVIAYQERQKDRFFTYFRPKGVYIAGTRFRAMPDYVEDFTFDAIDKFTREAPPPRKKATKIAVKQVEQQNSNANRKK